MKRMKLTKPILFLYKFSIVSGCCFVVLMVIGPIIGGILFGEKIAEAILAWMFGIATVFGVIVFILPFLFVDEDKISLERVEADSYCVNFLNFEHFISFVDSVANDIDLQHIAIVTHKNHNMHIYAKLGEKASMEVLQIIETDEFSDKILEESMNDHVEHIQQFYNRKLRWLANHINYTTVICVNRISKDFSDLVNSYADQSVGCGRIIAGLSFEDKRIFVSKKRPGYSKSRFNYYKRTFFDIFDSVIEADTTTQSSDDSIQQDTNS